MNKFKRSLALVLTLCMVLTLMPLNVFATESAEVGAVRKEDVAKMDGSAVDVYEAFADHDVEPLALTSNSVTLEYWITNINAYESQNTNSAHSVTISNNRTGIQTEDGVALTEFAPDVTYSNFDGWVTLYYWQAMVLDSKNQQTTDSGDDETADGVAMTHIRYMDGTWQYKNTAGEWKDFNSGDQLVAYYLQKTDVTDQIVTYSKDWGYTTDSNTPENKNNGQVALSVAVVDGSTLTPTEANIYAKSTTIFNYWEDRDIGIVAPENNSNYEIYKITVTAGSRTNNTSKNLWYPSDSITWEKTDNDLGTGKWYDETVVWDLDKDGGTPMVNGSPSVDNIIWPKKNSAFLVLIYIRAKNANLNVQYVDDSLDGALIYERGIFAKAEGTYFTELKQNSAVPSAGGYFTLDDDASVTYYNSETEKNITQTFEKNLLNFQEIAPQYRSGAYEYVGAELSADGLTLILHYNIDAEKLNPRYVVDFGLPVSVPLKQVVENYSEAKSFEVVSAQYGSAVIADNKLIYTPSTVLQAPAAVPVKITYNDGSVATRNVGFIPATTVYYEEGFTTRTGSWTGGSTGSGEQTLQTATDNTGNYGYDVKYAAETGMSNGTEAVSSASGDTAEFTFTGTGVDIYANCTPDTSTVAVMLYEGSKLTKMYQVDTAAVSGTSAATAGQDVTSYSLPIVSIQGLTHGTYSVKLYHTKYGEGNTDTFRLDGFRVYNTLVDETQVADYAADENAPTFVEVRNAVLTGLNVATEYTEGRYFRAGEILSQVYTNEGSLNGALVLSGNATVDLADLLVNGPKNELFLHPGDVLTFNLGSANAQIGLKALNGSASYTINSTANTITTSTDMFYHEGLTGKVTIQNTGTTILSVTKLKIFGSANLSELTENQVAYALTLLGYEVEGEVEAPEAPVESAPAAPADLAMSAAYINVVDYRGKQVAKVTLSQLGTVGESHVYTAEEILAAAEAQLPAGYALFGHEQTGDLTVAYGEAGNVTLRAGKIAVLNVNYVGMLSGETVGTAAITVVQTGEQGWELITASDIRSAAPEGRTALWMDDVRVVYGYSYSITVTVI